MTREEFLALPPEAQRETLAEMKRQGAEKIKAAMDEVFHHHELEKTLVPSINFRPAPTPQPSRVEISPPSGDPDVAAREFFKRFPETRSIRIGTVFYERS